MNIIQAKAKGEEYVADVRHNIDVLRRLCKTMQEKDCFRGRYVRLINLLLAYFKGKPYHTVERRVVRQTRPWGGVLTIESLWRIHGYAKEYKEAKVGMGVLLLKPDGGGQLVARFEAAPFIKDMNALVASILSNEAHPLDGLANEFIEAAYTEERAKGGTEDGEQLPPILD